MEMNVSTLTRRVQPNTRAKELTATESYSYISATRLHFLSAKRRKGDAGNQILRDPDGGRK